MTAPALDESIVVDVDNLTKVFPGPPEVTALRPCTFQIRRGELRRCHRCQRIRQDDTALTARPTRHPNLGPVADSTASTSPNSTTQTDQRSEPIASVSCSKRFTYSATEAWPTMSNSA